MWGAARKAMVSVDMMTMWCTLLQLQDLRMNFQGEEEIHCELFRGMYACINLLVQDLLPGTFSAPQTILWQCAATSQRCLLRHEHALC